jgi:hypothetical protein
MIRLFSDSGGFGSVMQAPYSSPAFVLPGLGTSKYVTPENITIKKMSAEVNACWEAGYRSRNRVRACSGMEFSHITKSKLRCASRKLKPIDYIGKYQLIAPA